LKNPVSIVSPVTSTASVISTAAANPFDASDTGDVVVKLEIELDDIDPNTTFLNIVTHPSSPTSNVKDVFFESNAVATLPRITNDNATTIEDTTVSIDVLANDLNTARLSKNTLVIGTDPLHGTATVVRQTGPFRTHGTGVDRVYA